jgi:hypothetical protein
MVTSNLASDDFFGYAIDILFDSTRIDVLSKHDNRQISTAGIATMSLVLGLFESFWLVVFMH